MCEFLHNQVLLSLEFTASEFAEASVSQFFAFVGVLAQMVVNMARTVKNDRSRHIYYHSGHHKSLRTPADEAAWTEEASIKLQTR
jgi:hypothetical protein